MKNIKIVLTGGPCGGKTSSIYNFANKLSNKYNILIVEETARALLKLGYLDEYPINTIDFQDILFKIQFINEYYSEQNSDLLLCDRGLFDALAYIDEKAFEGLLTKNKLDKNKLSTTYDKALYFRTIAYEYPESFCLQRIYETPTSAIQRDIQTLQIWKDKILKTKYDNTIGLEKKQDIIFSELSKYLYSSENNEHHNLFEYYSGQYIKTMQYDIGEIVERNKIPDCIKTRTLELIKW